MLSGVPSELLAFGEPWLVREPRLLIACRYAAGDAARARFLAAQLLLRELAEAAISASDQRVAEARLHWWLDEAAHWQQGHPRHPLAHGLQPQADAAPLAQVAAACLEWLERAPDDIAQAQARLCALAAPGARLAGGSEAAAHATWLAACVRQSLRAPASLATPLPLDLCARHGLRRSQWPELAPARRLELLAELVAMLPGPGAAAGTGQQPGIAAADAALQALDRRWLARLGAADADRLRIGDVFAAWRAARAVRA